MNFGVPREVRPLEYRVGLTPAAVDYLVRAGHKVLVEHNAGLQAGFSDEDYAAAGAQNVYSAREAYGRADVVIKVGRPAEEEYDSFRTKQAILSFLHLAVASPDLLNIFKKEKITAIGYETIRTKTGKHPVLMTTSVIAGRLAPIVAGNLLSSFHEGRGILLSGIPGAPPAAVVILGAGVLGLNAARAFYNLGGEVTVLEHDLDVLQNIDTLFGGKLATMFANPHNIAKTAAFADVLVTSAAEPGGKAPTLITRDILQKMQKRAVIMDLAINSGGNVETSHPTTLADPSYIEEGVIHYCVPNMPSRVARTGSYALSNAILPYLLHIGELGMTEACKKLADLYEGVNTLEGELVHEGVAAALGKNPEVDQ